MRSCYRACLPALCALCVVFVAACDLTDDDVTPTNVAGEYVFTEFRFVPDSPLLPPAVVLDTLVQSSTRLQLFSSGRFTLLYQFEGADPEFIGGDFSVNERRIRLSGHEDEAEFYRQLLLSPEITLQRSDEGPLTASIRRTVDLEEYSSRYEGLRTVDGVVMLELVRR